MRWTHFFLVLINIVSFGNSQKNILFLVADDMRPNLGVYEDSNSEIFKQPPMYTPNLDALASKSLLFENAYDVLPLCSPSRTSTLTGRRPDTTKILRIGEFWSQICHDILLEVMLIILRVLLEDLWWKLYNNSSIFQRKWVYDNWHWKDFSFRTFQQQP